MSPIPYFRPYIGPEEHLAVQDVLSSGWLTTGQQCATFENSFAETVGAKHAVALNSCTAALHLALVGLGIGPGDEVIVPTMTFAATAEVVGYTGAKLVLVDCDINTLSLDAEAASAAITNRTKAILPVHYGGQAADIDPLRSEAQSLGIAIVEDAAHAFPASQHGKMVGSLGTATCFSFYANKTITTG